VERDKALEMAMGQIEKQFGKGAIMRMGEKTNMGIEAISTGALALDLALGIGGLPRGRVVEIYGPESSGKSTLAMHVVAEAQRNGGICAYVDAEHAMDPVYASAIGVNIDELLISQPDTGEQALEIADMLIRSGALDIIVIDSVAALTPRAEIEGDMGDAHVGLQARLMSQALRKLTATLNRSDTIAIFINQLREKIGVMFGSPETTPGGKALKFYSSVRLDIRRIESIKDGAEITGNRTRVKVVKNKCVAEGTTVFDPSTGETHRIEDIIDHDAGQLVMASDKAGKLYGRRIVSRFDQGEADVVGLGLKDGTTLWATPDHQVMTEVGWREAGELAVGDRVARPRCTGEFGPSEPVSVDHARMLGYLIGDGSVTGKTPVSFTNVQAAHTASEKRIPQVFFEPSTSQEVLANLLFGLWESDGWVSKKVPNSGIRVGFTTSSYQLAHQLHWLLLRWGVGSTVQTKAPTGRVSFIGSQKVVTKLTNYDVRVSGIDNVQRFAGALPMWGPRGQVLVAELAADGLRKHRGSQRGYLPAAQMWPVLNYLAQRGVTPKLAAHMIGDSAGDPKEGMRMLLGYRRFRRDLVQRLADVLGSEFLYQVLDEDLWYDRITVVHPVERRRVFDIEVDEDHTFVANDVVVQNCSPPFRQAEFDIMYGKGISREGSLLDVAADLGIVKKSGAWYTYEGEQLGQGRENAKVFLAENLELMIEISERVRKQVGLGDAPQEDVPLGSGADDDRPIMLEE